MKADEMIEGHLVRNLASLLPAWNLNQQIAVPQMMGAPQQVDVNQVKPKSKVPSSSPNHCFIILAIHIHLRRICFWI